MHINTTAVGTRFPLGGAKKPCETQQAAANRNIVGLYQSRHSGCSNYNISQQRAGCNKKIPTPPKKCPRGRRFGFFLWIDIPGPAIIQVDFQRVPCACYRGRGTP